MANDMSEAIYPWQHEDWDRLQRLRDRLPHAILFHGAQGIGKVGFAEQFAQSVLSAGTFRAEKVEHPAPFSHSILARFSKLQDEGDFFPRAPYHKGITRKYSWIN